MTEAEIVAIIRESPHHAAAAQKLKRLFDAEMKAATALLETAIADVQKKQEE